MASLINEAFEKARSANRPALLTYTVAGDNTKKKSLEILKSISIHADICELGFPHNTPIADGGQIQTSAYRAIKNGIKINDVFEIAKEFKLSKKTTPIILMGYYNMIYQYNENKFLKKCKSSKIDGLIVVDLPYPENKSFSDKCKKTFYPSTFRSCKSLDPGFDVFNKIKIPLLVLLANSIKGNKVSTPIHGFIVMAFALKKDCSPNHAVA